MRSAVICFSFQQIVLDSNDENLKTCAIKVLTGYFYQLSQDPYGSAVVIKAIENGTGINIL
jgi:hypothetical protein